MISRSAPGAPGLARITIDLPPVNVLGVSHVHELAACIEDMAPARVLVLTGLPRAFSAGVDIADHVPEAGAIERMLAAMRRLLAALVETRAVTIASVQGACLGGGAEIAAACDFVIVAEDARIGFPEIRLAAFAPAATGLLRERVGEVRAADWLLTGRAFSGAEAAAAGFATRAVPARLLEPETRRLAADLLARSPAALDAARDLLREPRRQALAAALPRAEDAYRRLAGDESLARAVREFKKG